MSLVFLYLLMKNILSVRIADIKAHSKSVPLLYERGYLDMAEIFKHYKVNKLELTGHSTGRIHFKDGISCHVAIEYGPMIMPFVRMKDIPDETWAFYQKQEGLRS